MDVQHLLGHLLPLEAQVPNHRDQSQPDAPSLGQLHRAGIAIAPDPFEELRRRTLGEVARREDMGRNSAVLAAGLPRFREMRLDERPMPSAQLAERMQRLADAGALGPARTGAGRERHDGDLSGSQRGLANGLQSDVALEVSPVRDVPGFDILDARIRPKPILGESDAAFLEVRADLFVLGTVEAIPGEEIGE